MQSNGSFTSTSSDLCPVGSASSISSKSPAASSASSAIHCQRSSHLFSNWLESKVEWQQISNGGQSWWSFQLGSTFRKSKRTWKLALDNSLYLKRRKQISRFYGYKIFSFFPFITKTTGRTSIHSSIWKYKQILPINCLIYLSVTENLTADIRPICQTNMAEMVVISHFRSSKSLHSRVF